MASICQPTTLAVETELADFDEYEVRVYDVRRGRRLVAAIEIISPANKDRVENRHQFVSKCAALLRQGVSLVLVDLVTVRNFNLYVELLQLIGERDPALGEEPPATYAAACCWRPRGGSRWLEVWNHPLTLLVVIDLNDQLRFSIWYIARPSKDATVGARLRELVNFTVNKK